MSYTCIDVFGNCGTRDPLWIARLYDFYHFEKMNVIDLTEPEIKEEIVIIDLTEPDVINHDDNDTNATEAEIVYILAMDFSLKSSGFSLINAFDGTLIDVRVIVRRDEDEILAQYAGKIKSALIELALRHELAHCSERLVYQWKLPSKPRPSIISGRNNRP